MATVGIWKIEKRLDHVVDYTTDSKKTINEDYASSYYNLHKVIDYTETDFKTENKYYVTGINCSPDSAYEEMMLTKEAFGKTKGILGFHAFQSFKEGEATPELVHEIGVKLAQEMWGDRFEVIISTHLNTKHYHNHFVINSVSFKDGGKYYDTRSTYAELRRLSNMICEEYGLSILKEKPCKNSKINYGNYQIGINDRTNYYTIAKEDLDRAIAQAYSYADFEALMKAMDYELIYRAGKLSIKREPYKKNIRIARFFGEDYSIDNITERIKTTQAPRIPFIEEYGNKNVSYKTEYKKAKHKGFYGLYLHYCYILKVFPTKYPYKKLPPSVRADIKKLDHISEQAKLLSSKKIETSEQFFSFKKEKEKELDVLLDSRSKLWYKHKKATTKEDKEKIIEQIEILNKKINPLRKEVKLCDEIDERMTKVISNLESVYEEKGKEVGNHEHIR